MSEEKILTPWQILRNKFPANEYVLIEEVSDKSGFDRSRSLDYMLVNLWNSRGLAITGIEQKSWRNDWLKELKNPKKQENHFKHCDYFYLLTTAEGVAKLDEIPISWGWYHIKGNKIFTMKQAPKLNPLPIDRSLMCAMLRRAADKKGYVRIESIQDKIDEACDRKKVDMDYQTRGQLEELKKLKEQVKIFEEESGIKIETRWSWNGDAKKGAQAAKWLQVNGVDSFEKKLLQLRDGAKRIHEDVSKTLDQLITEPIRTEDNETDY